ncbi:TRAP-type mannitol/chloroaromatic compound transport system substrate-binding protein [Tamilnaduibacter salinus]|uniref:C4-dicarboxylate ABC transporter n=1 Tax=Tamilnaduibacter salinus TaxID=1484056 RepID=A0A2A2I1T1_9GAMM|nr:TRAP transporter substrate-binding protein [Tamilnaduibacter salinus]PAV25607.1 C4-dicarboxylate ABC transporter [Tamilnaduibacter salinus]PVY78092.1 TRAP-type mannitol/chloroaromatic compound transport system substrate-binding protein [Tamilnaduibacter salinus]
MRATTKRLSVLSACGLAAAIATAPVQAADNVRWKMQAAYGTNLPALGDTIPSVLKDLRDVTDNRLYIKHYEPNKLVGTLEIMDAVRSGKIASGFTWIGYDQGKVPSSILFSAVPFGMEPWEYMAWWYEGGGQQLAEDIYHDQNIHPVLCGLTGPETGGWFNKEINSIQDMEGLKIRYPGIGGKILQEVGASVTTLAGGEIFQALEKGAIDASEFSLPTVDKQLGFFKVAEYNYFPGWHQPFAAFHLTVNKEKWDAISDVDKKLINMSCQAGVTRNLAQAEATQGEAIEYLEDQGAKTRKLPDSVLKELEEVAETVLEREASQNEDFARVYESQKDFMDQYQRWQDLGYLPRDF